MFKGTPELIEQRREEIVNACEQLYRTKSFGEITLKDIGNMTSFTQYALNVVMSFVMLIVVFIMLPRAVVSAKRIREVLKTEPSIVSGKKKKGKERALIDRLIKLKDSVCLFIHNFLVPFDNNQAERDLRNVKTKAKVSGCFRTKAGALTYLKITSYLSTAKKHGINAFEALALAFKGETEKVLI